MKKKKGFTLIELLASLVILAFILVIAVPKIVNVIDNSKLGTITSSAKVVLDSAEKKQSENQVLENPSIINCENVSKLNDTDYSSCDLTFNNKIPYIVLVGSGKLEGYKCEGTKDNLNCRKVVNISLTIDLDGGTGNNQAGSYERNTTLELISPSKEGYTFTGWKIVSGDGSINNSVLTLGIKNMKIKALYQLNEQKLNIDLDGGTGNNQAGSYTVGSNVTLPVPTKEGYDFSGWELISGNSNLSGNSITIGSEETSIKATWIKKVTLTLDLDGGTITSNASGVYSRNTTITLGTPTKTGYNFSKWQITAGDSTLSGNKLTIGTTDTTIKAIYTAKKYTVTYNANGGTVNTSSRIVTYDDTYGTLVTPERLGYSFLGWYTTKTGGSKISSNTVVKITSNQTIYAHWQLEYLVCNNSVIKCGVAESDLKSTSITQFLRYTGTCEYICDDASSGNFRIKFKTSGKLLSTETTKIDAFLVGGGGGGADSDRITDLTQYGGDTYRHGGAGGGGGYTTTKKNITLTKNTTYTITIGAGGLKADDKKAGDGGTTSAFEATALGGKGGNVGSESNGAGIGGDGGSGGGNYSFYTPSPGGSDGANSGGKGQGTTTAEFGETGRTLYSGGGAGGRESFNWYCKDAAASEGGGGGTGENGTANTGGGGGGGRGGNSGGNGGSGIVVIRNVVPEPEDKVTFSKMLNNYKCSYSSGSTTGLYFTYTGKCSLLNDSGTHYKVVFTTSGTLKIYSSLPIDAFLVAGGGGGSGNSYGYGGNGGEVVTEKGITLTAGSSYSIVIGAGGAGGDYLSRGSNGSNTTAFGITAHGGLGGGNTSNSYGSAGGTPSSDNCTPAKGKSYGIGGQYKNSNSQTTCEFNEAIFNSSGTITGCKAKAYGPGGGAKCTSESNCGYNNCGSAGGVDGGGYGAGYLDNYHQGGGSATANTGGGGGAGSNVQGNEGGGGSGGSGIVMIRDAR